MPTAKELTKYYPKQKYYAYGAANDKGLFTQLRRYLLHRQYEPNVITTLLHLIIPRVPAIPNKVPDGKILDIGCGTGETLLLLKQLRWKTYGMDIDKKAIAIAKKRGVDHVRVGYCQDIAAYPDNFFDAIRLYHVIEHLDNPILCLQLIRKKLKKGGQLIIGTPNVESLISRVFRTYWYNLDTPRHVVLFSPKTLERAIIETKFVFPHVEFCSAGGLLGSIQYALVAKHGLKFNLIHNQWLVLLIYPIEWILDKMRIGDIFVMRVEK